MLQNSQEKKLYWSLFLIKLQASGPAILLKRYSSKGAFPWILWFFKSVLFTEQFRAAAFEYCTIGAFYPELNQIQISGVSYCSPPFLQSTVFQQKLFNIQGNNSIFVYREIFVNFYKNIFTEPFSKLLFVGFVSALFSDSWNPSSDKTSAKE